jgi:DNA-binding transcriptional LysR family regulator
MNPWKLKLSQLRALLAVAEYGNFSEAALQLEVTQSTISHAIATLETELGVVLFTRGRHGAQLTPVGDRAVAHAHSIQGALEALVNTADQAKGLKGGTVRVGSFRSVSTHVLPGAISRLHSRYPDIQITLLELDEAHQLKQALLQGQIDVCVAELMVGEEFETFPIVDDEYIALSPPTSGRRDGQLTLDDLANHTLIASAHSSCFSRIEKKFASLENPLKVHYRIRHDSSMTGMVQQGLGIAILPRLAAEPIPDGVQVCRLPFALSRPIGASLLQNALRTPALYAFLDALQETGEFAPSPAILSAVVRANAYSGSEDFE